MAKKMIKNKSTKQSSSRKAKREVRRHPIKTKNSHWKFKNSKKSLKKFNAKQAKAIKKESSIKKEEAEIQLIENENELFDEAGYYNQPTADEDKGMQ